ncbi:MAG TPA: hypothetical protein VFC68_02455 [Treponemataceae bacterium]|nr:hypothetical protein [Treponemataceae bacterium]
MKTIKKIIILLIIGSITMSACGKTITILSCQNNAGTDKILDVVTHIETGIMDVLFDSGHIVTSEETIVHENMEKKFNDIVYYYKTEKNVQYIVYIEFVFKTNDKKHSEYAGYNKLSEIYWKVIKIHNNTIIGEKRQNLGEKNVNFYNDVTECGKLGKLIGMDINTIIVNE